MQTPPTARARRGPLSSHTAMGEARTHLTCRFGCALELHYLYPHFESLLRVQHHGLFTLTALHHAVTTRSAVATKKAHDTRIIITAGMEEVTAIITAQLSGR